MGKRRSSSRSSSIGGAAKKSSSASSRPRSKSRTRSNSSVAESSTKTERESNSTDSAIVDNSTASRSRARSQSSLAEADSNISAQGELFCNRTLTALESAFLPVCRDVLATERTRIVSVQAFAANVKDVLMDRIGAELGYASRSPTLAWTVNTYVAGARRVLKKMLKRSGWRNSGGNDDGASDLDEDLDDRDEDDAQEIRFTSAMSESITRISTHKGGHRHVVKGFALIDKKPAASLYSAQFSVGGKMWQLVCYPGGEKEEASEYVSLFLGFRGPETKCRATWLLRVVNQKPGGRHKERSWNRMDQHNVFEQTKRWGWQKFIRRDTLLDEENGYLSKDGTIILEAELEVYGEHETKETSEEIESSQRKEPASLSAETSTMCDDYRALRAEETLADVAFALDSGTRMVGHRQILAARSPVFRSMFSGGYLESSTSRDGSGETVVPVPGCDDDIFNEFLNFMYSGSIDESFFRVQEEPETDSAAQAPPEKSSSKSKRTLRLRPGTNTDQVLGKRKRHSRRSSFGSVSTLPECDNNIEISAPRVVSLLTIADQYEVNRLRTYCVDILESELRVSNAVELLIIADRHFLSSLKTVILDFVASNATSVTQTDAYKDLDAPLLKEVCSRFAAHATRTKTSLKPCDIIRMSKGRCISMLSSLGLDQKGDRRSVHALRKQIMDAHGYESLDTAGDDD